MPKVAGHTIQHWLMMLCQRVRNSARSKYEVKIKKKTEVNFFGSYFRFCCSCQGALYKGDVVWLISIIRSLILA